MKKKMKDMLEITEEEKELIRKEKYNNGRK